MVAPPEVPRNAEGGAMRRAASKKGWGKERGPKKDAPGPTLKLYGSVAVASSRHQRTGQRTLHQDAGTGAPTGIANTVPANKNDSPPIVRSGTPRCCGCKIISRKTYPFERPADACVYRTLQQEQSRSQPLPHTVLSRKPIPYRPTNVCSLRQVPDATTKAYLQKTCKSRGFYVAWYPERIYRTLR
jgi:hypothetical protein